MTAAIALSGLHKTYDNDFVALKPTTLAVQPGEIFALLGPNGAGKTTLINAICGIVQPTGGSASVSGYDTSRDYREARARIGLVPQELSTDAFETVWNTVTFSRGLFGKPPANDYLKQLLQQLSLWDKKDTQIRKLSGGMKRRVLIAKALSHEPDILFLDEPSAGVDVDLRKSMWQQVRALRDTGVTIILTTHYIEEAEEMADRIGIIRKGELILTEDKHTLMKTLGSKELVLDLAEPLPALPAAMQEYDLRLEKDGQQLVYTYDAAKDDNSVVRLLEALARQNIRPRDLQTRQSSLEDIFLQLVNQS